MENKVNGTVKEVFKLYTLQSNMTKLKERDEAIMKEKNVNLELHKKITTALGNDKVKNTIAEVKLRQKEEEIKREKNENVNLQRTSASAKGEPPLLRQDIIITNTKTCLCKHYSQS
ncbi:uncharacterized protein [Apostichopus japonicus]|uniref:uncharacterized protein isoform X7 n=1 Tax=Stichopus japonicus TaxID=307972 RepID=UPI003AB6A1EC